MTSPTTARDPVADHMLTAQYAALLITDFQPVQVGSIASMNKRLLVANVVAVARTAKLYGVPPVLTTVNVTSGHNQPMLRPITDVLSGVPIVDRTSINAWEDDDFVAAVKATGRKKLIMVALWTEVCLVFPALDALQEGFDVYVVIDAVGGTSEEAHRAGLQRIIQAGGIPVSWIQLACELQGTGTARAPQQASQRSCLPRSATDTTARSANQRGSEPEVSHEFHPGACI